MKNLKKEDAAIAAGQALKEKNYWAAKLAGEPAKSSFPYDRVKTRNKEPREDTVKFKITHELFSRLMALSKGSDYTLHVIHAAELVLLLHKYTRHNDIIVGTPIDRQQREEDFINTVLPLRNQISAGMTFKDLLLQVRQTIVEAVDHQNYPMETLLFDLGMEYNGNDFPLFDTAILLENIQEKKYLQHLRTGLTFSFSRTEAGVECDLSYNTSLYHRETVQRIAAHFISLIKNTLFNVDVRVLDAEVLTENDKNQLVFEFNNTHNEYPGEKTLHGLFARQVEKTPNYTALSAQIPKQEVTGGLAPLHITYRELNKKSNQLAGLLRKKGTGPGIIVGIMVKRSLEMIIGLLGILKSGGSYLPLDPEHPGERIKYILEDTRVNLLLTQQNFPDKIKFPGESMDLQQEELYQDERASNPEKTGQPSDLAYIIFTSGSTGKPKGVMIQHQSIVNMVHWRKNFYGFHQNDAVLQVQAYTFDSSLEEIFTPLISGSRLVLTRQPKILDITLLKDVIKKNKISHFSITPALYKIFLSETHDNPGNMKSVTIGGDYFTEELVVEHFKKLKTVELYNEYGPTENTVCTTVYKFSPKNARVLIGKPIHNTRCYIVNENMQLIPIGVTGELCISGAGAARGYLNNPELTNSKFQISNQPGNYRSHRSYKSYIIYKTGDLARWLPDGNIEFLGRTDHQVKIRGFRVEPGEIENQLLSHKIVKEAVVLARPDRDGNRCLAAYVVPDQTHAFTVKQLLRMEKQGLMAEHHCGELPNGMPVFYLNRNEKDFMYRENIEEHTYFKKEELLLGDGACIFDVGANIGTFTLLLHRQYRQQCKDMKFYLFEPIPPICQLLRLNTTLYGIDAQVFEYGLAAAEAEVEFTYFPHISILSAHLPRQQEELDRLKTIIRNRHLSENQEEALIDHLLEDRLTTTGFTGLTKTLSQMMRENRVNRIDLLKIDIGKYGKEVLKGIDEAHWHRIRQIVIEVDDIDGDLEWVMPLLKAKRFDISISNSHRDIPTLYRIYASAGDLDKTMAHISQSGKGEDISPGLLSIKGMTRQLQRYAKEILPGYMVPSSILVLDELPVTPTGKIDRLALLESGSGETSDADVPLKNQAEEKLAEIWADVLGKDKEDIGRGTNFFEAGGHSLSATIMAARVHKELNVKLPLAEIFKKPTIRSLAQHLKETVKKIFTPLEPVEKKEYYPLSPTQQRLYVLNRVTPDSISYNVPQAVVLEGYPDREKFKGIFIKLLERHQGLRTSFHLVKEQPVQRLHENVQLEIEFYNLATENTESTEKKNHKIQITNKKETKGHHSFVRPFDLSRVPLLRVGLIAERENRHLLLVDMHHIIADGTSMGVLIKEFMELYQGRELPGTRIQYKDFSEWQNRLFAGGEMQKQEEYWQKHFDGEIPVLNLLTDYPRPSVQSFAGRTINFEIDKEKTAALRALAGEQNVTLFMLLLSVYNIFLSKLSGQEDIVVGTPIAGRSHSDLESIIGMFVNTLALRNFPVGQRPFPVFLEELKERTLQAFANRDYPFEELVEQVETGRDASRNPLFDTMFVVQNVDELKIEIPGLKVRSFDYEKGTAKFDLTLTAIEAEEKLFFIFEYCTKLFKEQTIQRFILYFNNIISTILEKPGGQIARIDILTGKEKKRIMYEFNNTAVYSADKTIHRLFEEQVEQRPNQAALVGPISQIPNNARGHGMAPPADYVSITYRELNERSNRLAFVLKEKGIEPGTIVGIMVEPSLERIIGLLGILKAGGAYLPIDPNYPRERIDYMLNDSHAKILLKSHANDQYFTTTCMVLNFEHLNFEFVSNFEIRDSDLDAANFAYIIYTSGSTGNPKGVLITHRNVCPLMHWGYRNPGLSSNDHTIQNLPYIFDWSVWEIFITLVSGASLYIPHHEVILDPGVGIDFIKTRDITVLHVTPTQFQYFLNTGLDFSTLGYLFIGAEKLTYSLVQRAFNVVRGDCRVFNMYGPTEAAIISAALEIQRKDKNGYEGFSSIPIGKPAANAKLLILDKHMNWCPVNVAGELVIGGDCVSKGYLNNPGLTAEKFDQDLWDYRDYQDKRKKEPGSHMSYRSYRSYITKKLYKTGDMTRWLEDGNIEFLGRIDHQVKLRGYRVELGEIENQILNHPGIKEAVVIPKKHRDGEQYLCAYIVINTAGESAAPPDRTMELKEYLTKSLPGFMIPSYFVEIEKIPLNPNGKLDRKALPEPGMKAARYIAPRDDTEEKLVQIWMTELQKDKVGIDDNFFDIGGNSLKIILVIKRIDETFGKNIPVVTLFRFTTIRAIAKYLNNEEKTIRGREKELMQGKKDRTNLLMQRKRAG